MIGELARIKKLHVVPRRSILAFSLTHLYCALGNKDEAIHWAKVAAEKRAIYAPSMAVDAVLALIHDDPRFRTLMAPIKRPA